MPRISNTTGVHHVLILGDDGSQEFILLFLRHSEVFECLGDLAPDLIELFRGEVEMLVGFVEGLAGILEGPASCLTRSQGPHELESRQLSLLVPFL